MLPVRDPHADTVRRSPRTSVECPEHAVSTTPARGQVPGQAVPTAPARGHVPRPGGRDRPDRLSWAPSRRSQPPRSSATCPEQAVPTAPAPGHVPLAGGLDHPGPRGLPRSRGPDHPVGGCHAPGAWSRPPRCWALCTAKSVPTTSTPSGVPAPGGRDRLDRAHLARRAAADRPPMRTSPHSAPLRDRLDRAHLPEFGAPDLIAAAHLPRSTPSRPPDSATPRPTGVLRPARRGHTSRSRVLGTASSFQACHREPRRTARRGHTARGRGGRARLSAGDLPRRGGRDRSAGAPLPRKPRGARAVKPAG